MKQCLDYLKEANESLEILIDCFNDESLPPGKIIEDVEYINKHLIRQALNILREESNNDNKETTKET